MKTLLLTLLVLSACSLSAQEVPPPPPPPVPEIMEIEGEEEIMEEIEIEFELEPEMEEESDEIYSIVEVMPEFPGGNEALFTFIRENIVYPEDALEENVQGVVYVTFVVREDGHIDDVRVLRGIYPSLDTEAKRVVKRMPKWEPGTQRGAPVNVQYNLPIRFEL